MMSPFDRKNALAGVLDRFSLRVLVLALCIGYFFFLWRSGMASLLAGGALFILICLSAALVEKRTLSRRDRLLRERIGGMRALEDLIRSPSGAASARVCDVLCKTLGAAPAGDASMRYGDETWLIRLAQCLPGTSASQSDVLSAHRARIEYNADKVTLASTAGFSPEAVRAAEWADPPVRLIAGRQLAQLFGRLYPATDAEIARHLARQKKPFTRQRIRALALSPAKTRRYLLCSFLLLMLYLMADSLPALIACLLSYTLAILSAQEGKRRFIL